MRRGFKTWLARRLGPNSLNSYMVRARKIEDVYGDLDALYEEDRLQDLIEIFAFSKDDERHGRPNPTDLVFGSHLYSNLSSCRTLLRSYIQYREADGSDPELESDDPLEHAGGADVDARYISLEADLQQALRNNIAQIEPGLSISDDGNEKYVESGFIDILAADLNGHPVVIELKAVTARREVLGQIAAYMADIADETGQRPRGILIAPEFDDKLVRAAKMVEGLSLMRYSFTFTFDAI